MLLQRVYRFRRAATGGCAPPAPGEHFTKNLRSCLPGFPPPFGGFIRTIRFCLKIQI